MAEMYTPEEIQAIFREYNEAVKNGTPISKELAQSMKDAQIGVKNYTAELNSSMKKLGSSMVGLAGAIKDGAEGASTFNSGIESAADAVDKFASGFGPIGFVIGKLVSLLGKYAVEANKQSDALFKTYQDLNKFGAATAGGMTDVFANMQKFGYGINELDKMIALVRENAKDLGLFNTTVAAGAKELANIAEGVQRSGLQTYFMNMGMTVDDINRGLAGYLVQQGRLGRKQTMTQDELAKGAAEYVKEMQILTRLTGQQREEMEQQREQAMMIDQFFAVVNESGVAGKEMMKVYNQLMSVSPAQAKAFAESVSGFVGTSEEQNRLFMASGGALISNMDALKNGTINAAQYVDRLGLAVNQNMPLLTQIAKIPGSTDFAGPLATNSRLANKALQGVEKGAQEAADSLNIKDAATAAAVGLRQNTKDIRDATQGFINYGVEPATKALQGLTGAASRITRGVTPGAPAAPQGGAIPSGAPAAAPAAGAGGLSGLRIKSMESTAGGATSERLASVARAIQDKLGGDLRHFTAFNDSYHRGNNSLHTQGRAMDFTLTDPAKAAMIADMVRGIPGVSRVLDEYNFPSARATAGHIHAEIAAKYGGTFSGPLDGYRAVLHGTEAVVPLPNGRSIPVEIPGFTANLSDQTTLLNRQIEKLDELVRTMRNQVDVSTKILQRTS